MSGLTQEVIGSNNIFLKNILSLNSINPVITFGENYWFLPHVTIAVHGVGPARKPFVYSRERRYADNSECSVIVVVSGPLPAERAAVELPEYGEERRLCARDGARQAYRGPVLNHTRETSDLHRYLN